MTMDAYLDQVRGLIAEHGIAVQGVMDDDPFAYTIGLTRHQHPELILYGLPHGHAARTLNYLADRVLNNGERLTPDSLILMPLGDPPDLTDSVTLGFAPEPTTDLKVARALYGQAVEALRVRAVRPR